MEWTVGGDKLSSVNAANSAFGLFVFHEPFFSYLFLEGEDYECQVHIKSLLAMLRVRGSVHQCSFRLAPDDVVSRLAIQIDCEHGVCKRHQLTYEDCPGLFPTLDFQPPFALSVPPRTAKEWTEHFLNSGKTGECSLCCSPDACTLRSRMDGPLEAQGTPRRLTPDQVRSSIQSEVRLPLAEMSEYHVHDTCLVNFSLWEFRAAIHVAEQLGSQLALAFGYGGDPLFIRLYVSDALGAEFVLATTGEGPAKARASPPVSAAAIPPVATVPPPPSASSEDDDLLPARPPKPEPTPPEPHPRASQVPLSQLLVQPTPLEHGGNRDEHHSTLFSPSLPADDHGAFFATQSQDEVLPPTQPPVPRKKVRETAPLTPQFRPLF